MKNTGKKMRIRERRKFQRLNISIPVKYKFLPRKKILKEIFCKNISGGGLKLRLDYPLKKGDRLKTFLYFPGDSTPVTAFSKVTWCRRITQKGRIACYDAGVQHLKIIPKDRQRLVFLFCEMMLDYFLFGKGRK